MLCQRRTTAGLSRNGFQSPNYLIESLSRKRGAACGSQSSRLSQLASCMVGTTPADCFSRAAVGSRIATLRRFRAMTNFYALLGTHTGLAEEQRSYWTPPNSEGKRSKQAYSNASARSHSHPTHRGQKPSGSKTVSRIADPVGAGHHRRRRQHPIRGRTAWAANSGQRPESRRLPDPARHLRVAPEIRQSAARRL